MNRAITMLIVGLFIGATTTAWSATAGNARYTPREVLKLKAHSCMEDEYLFIPATRVNDNVHYATPDVAMCAHVDNVRIAP